MGFMLQKLRISQCLTYVLVMTSACDRQTAGVAL